MSTYAQQIAITQNTEFLNMAKVAIVAASVAVLEEDPVNDVTPPAGFEPDGVEATRKKEWHVRRSNRAAGILQNPGHYVEAYALAIANNMGAYVESGNLKYGAGSDLTDSDIQFTTNALFNGLSGGHTYTPA